MPPITPTPHSIVTSEEDADNACFGRLESDLDDYYDQLDARDEYEQERDADNREEAAHEQATNR